MREAFADLVILLVSYGTLSDETVILLMSDGTLCDIAGK